MTLPYKCLGLQIDENLIWYCHFDTICKKASAGIEDMRNIKNNHFVPARENELRERIPVPHV